MTDRPILFSAPMVRALLEGRKTQTRRVLQPQPLGGTKAVMQRSSTIEAENGQWIALTGPVGKGINNGVFRVPYAVGDRLWVRETWRTTKNMDGAKPSEMSPHSVEYLADDEREVFQLKGRKRSSLHMPRWASRLTLTVTEVRVQRLQEISAADAVAEGIQEPEPGWWSYTCPPRVMSNTHRGAFRVLWNSLHGPDAWDADPWIAALTFTVTKGNIDA